MGTGACMSNCNGNAGVITINEFTGFTGNRGCPSVKNARSETSQPKINSRFSRLFIQIISKAWTLSLMRFLMVAGGDS